MRNIESDKEVIANYFGYSTFEEFKVREKSKNCKGTIGEAILNIVDELENGETADELFEELGYEIIVNDEITLIYKNGVIGMDKEIVLEKANRGITISYSTGDSCYMNMQELQAINQKCKEMGWIE